MTSNIGAELIKRDMSIGFATHVDSKGDRQVGYENMKGKVLGEMKKKFRPEFLNRIDATVVFHALSKEDIRQIVELMLDEVAASLKEKNVTLEVTDVAKDLLGNKGYDPVFGARPLRRVIQDLVEDPLSESLLRGEFQSGDAVEVDTDGEKIVMRSLVKGTS
jgi:ATP-dependent Clp protease ATP-binding subunit ClpC